MSRNMNEKSERLYWKPTIFFLKTCSLCRKSRGASFEDKWEYTEIYTNIQTCTQIYINRYIYKDKTINLKYILIYNDIIHSIEVRIKEGGGRRFIFIYVSIYVYLYICVFVCIFVYIFVYLCIFLYIRTYLQKMRRAICDNKNHWFLKSLWLSPRCKFFENFGKLVTAKKSCEKLGICCRKSRGASFEDKCEYTEIYPNILKNTQIYVNNIKTK